MELLKRIQWILLNIYIVSFIQYSQGAGLTTDPHVTSVPVLQDGVTDQEESVVTPDTIDVGLGDSHPETKKLQAATQAALHVTEAPAVVSVAEDNGATVLQQEAVTDPPMTHESQTEVTEKVLVSVKDQNLGDKGAALLTTQAADVSIPNTEVVKQDEATTQGVADGKDQAVETTVKAEESASIVQNTTQAKPDIQTTQAPGDELTVKEETVKHVVVTTEEVQADKQTSQANPQLTTGHDALIDLTTLTTQQQDNVELTAQANHSQVQQTTSSAHQQDSVEMTTGANLSQVQLTTSSSEHETNQSDGFIVTSKEQNDTTHDDKSNEIPVTTVKLDDIKVVTEQAEEEITQPQADSNDPCDNSELLKEDERYLTHQGSNDICDQLKEQWYAFKYQGNWAEIPAIPIKTSYCGTEYPFHLELDNNQQLPEFNETITAHICTVHNFHGDMDKCVLKKKIQVKRCTDHYIYFLQPLMTECKAAVCTKLPEETVPYDVLANPTPTPPAETTASTTKQTLHRQIPPASVSESESKGIVTVEFTYPNETLDKNFEKQFRAILIKAVNELSSTEAQATEAVNQRVTTDSSAVVTTVKPVGGRQPVTEATPHYNDNDVIYISPTPSIKDGKLQMSIIVKDKDGNVVPAEKLMEAVKHMNLSNYPGVLLEKVYEGLPEDTEAQSSKKKNIWEAHMALWITIIALMIVCLLTLLICCVCFRCCEATPAYHEKTPLQMEEGKKTPTFVIDNPLPDEEITKDEAPMVEHENPAITPNGGGEHLIQDEDNGWVVPLDQLTDAEKQKVDVENTKL